MVGELVLDFSHEAGGEVRWFWELPVMNQQKIHWSW
jgi:hypothetical protein